MNLIDILSPQRTLVRVDGSSKEEMLAQVSKIFTSHLPHMDPTSVYACLEMREQLGSTGIGHGVAIPHGRISNLEHAMGVFLQLHQPIDFGAFDHQPVDLIFALLVPQEANEMHLQILSTLAQHFSNEKLRAHLRTAANTERLYDLITGTELSCV